MSQNCHAANFYAELSIHDSMLAAAESKFLDVESNFLDETAVSQHCDAANFQPSNPAVNSDDLVGPGDCVPEFSAESSSSVQVHFVASLL